MIETTQGIVLHYTPFSETSVIVRIYTLQHGMQSYMIKGIRKPKARYSMNLLQPLSLIEFISHNKENRNVQHITELKADVIYKSIPYDISKTAIAFFIAELFSKCSRDEEANDELFHFLKDHLVFLDCTDQPVALFHHWFMIHLTKYLGFFPAGKKGNECIYFDLREGIYQKDFPPYIEFVSGRTAELISLLCEATGSTFHLIKTTTDERKDLLDALLLYYKLHALHGGKINSYQVLTEVLS